MIWYKITTKKESYIQFLTKNESCNVFKKAKSYFNNMTNADKQARNLPSSEKDIVVHYCNNTLLFTKKEKEVIQEIIDYFKTSLPENSIYSKKLLHNWKFAKGDETLENGYPHTHKDTIILSESFLRRLVEKREMFSLEECIQEIGYVLLHEKVHIWQKEEPIIFQELYTSILNFEKITLPEKDKTIIKAFHRNNPDGENYNWAFIFDDFYYLPLAKYNTKIPSSLKDVDYVCFALEKTGTTYHLQYPIESIPLHAHTKFQDYYGLHGNHYHPNEISAEIISLICIEKMGLLYPYKKTPAYIKIDNWFLSL